MDSLWAYSNGDWIADAELKVSVHDVGFLLGATVTERLRTFRHEVFRLDAHLARMRHSLEIVGLDAEGIIAQVGRAIPEFVERNRSQIAADDDWSILAFATPGVSGAGRPTVCIHGYPLPFRQWAEKYERGVSVLVSDVRQVPPNCWPPELKCRSRMHYYLADARAAADKPGARAILLDQEGYVAEATTANVLIFRQGEGLVSPTSKHILSGVSLSVVEELAAQLKIPLVKRNLTIDELRSADEVMLASTSVCLLPIVACDRQAIGDGRPGPTFRRLLAAWSEMVGIEVDEQARRCADRQR
jgi:branched-subunit amino acid aminotransferase/4-amino-4-deoxychorismate lyase